MYSWGNDGELLEANCRLINATFPMKINKFFDIRKIFSAKGIRVKKYMSSTIIKAFNKKSTARGRDGLNDARSIVDSLRELKTK